MARKQNFIWITLHLKMIPKSAGTSALFSHDETGVKCQLFQLLTRVKIIWWIYIYIYIRLYKEHS